MTGDQPIPLCYSSNRHLVNNLPLFVNKYKQDIGNKTALIN